MDGEKRNDAIGYHQSWKFYRACDQKYFDGHELDNVMGEDNIADACGRTDWYMHYE